MPDLGRRRLVWLGAAAALPGCGFHPLYARSSGLAGPALTEMGAVSVGIIPDRPGQLLRQALQERFEREGEGIARRYDLAVSFSIAGEGIGIQADTSTTRMRLIARAHWVLKAQDPTHTLLSSGDARTVDGYDAIDNQAFAFDLTNEAVQRRMAEAVADTITEQVAVYFSRRAMAG